MKNTFQYDTVRYRSNVFTRLRPELIGAVGILHGVTPKSISNCRFLEFGCGDGISLMSIANSLPDSECVGVDLSSGSIAEAKKRANDIGLTNAAFYHLDVSNFEPAEFGKFDFIVAHGLYSWVPAKVRDRLLQLYKECLAPNGLGYISYNTFPGWHLRNILRDAGRFIIGDEPATVDDANKVVDFLRLLSNSADGGPVYDQVLKSELNALEIKAREILFHDELAEINHPFYVTEFISQIQAAGLAFLGEADPIMGFTDQIAPEAKPLIQHLLNEPAKREQCLDFLRGTRFRSTLVCHPQAKPTYLPDKAFVDGLYLSSFTSPADNNPNLLDDSSVSFTTKSDATFSTNFNFTKVTLNHLGKHYPRPFSFVEIQSLLREHFDDLNTFDEKLELFRQHVLGLYTGGVISLTACIPHFSVEVSDRPKASAFARWQGSIGYPYLTNLLGHNVHFESAPAVAILKQADGTHSLDQIAHNFALTIGPEYEKELTPDIDPLEFTKSTLDQLQKLGLLVS